MSTQKVNLTSPVGRIVAGNLYKPNVTDFDGKPLTVKTGPNAGQPRTNYFFALAILKGPEPHWAHTVWGGKIWQVGNTLFPQAAQRPDFAWKIEDGDSTIPNKRGKKPCDNEGWPGHWIIRFSGGFAPKVYRPEGAGFVQVMEPDYVKPGYFVEVYFNVDGNDNQNNSGVYINYDMICFRAYGPEIVFGPNVNEAGFGQSQLPAGASMTPPPSAIPMPAAATAPSVPSAAMPTPIAHTPAPLPIPAHTINHGTPIQVTPNPQFLQVPLPAGAPLPTTTPALATSPVATALPPVVPAVTVSPSSPQMTAKAGGSPYQAFIEKGWTDANLIAQGYMTI